MELFMYRMFFSALSKYLKNSPKKICCIGKNTKKKFDIQWNNVNLNVNSIYIFQKNNNQFVFIYIYYYQLSIVFDLNEQNPISFLFYRVFFLCRNVSDLFER